LFFVLDRSNIDKNKGAAMANLTIHDVAARAGVSKSTVSLVLQNSTLVKGATREKVARIMVEMGYVYNTAAAGLRSKSPVASAAVSAQPVAVVALSTDLADADCAAFATAMQKAAAGRGMGLHLLAPNAPWQGRRISTHLDDTASDTTLTALHHKALARQLEGLAATKATRHLLGMGATEVAFVGGDPSHPVDKLRIGGYLQRLSKVGIAPLHLTGGYEFSFGRRALSKLLLDHPNCSAALCINDQVALGMISALAEMGIPLGEEFRVVGWGDTPVAAMHSLSSITPALPELASACVTWALDGGAQTHEVEPALIRRASSMGGT
jgi:LacI family transcriptional regulator